MAKLAAAPESVGRSIRPNAVSLSDARIDVCDALTLASSNLLRDTLRADPATLIPGVVPRVVTRHHPSLDNYAAELLLRARYAPTDEVPPFEEQRIRGAGQIISSADNPFIAGAILLGFGGLATTGEPLRVFDEHTSGGARIAQSVTTLVFAEHVRPHAAAECLAAIDPIVGEISNIDAHGGSSADHLYSLLKILHVARFSQPGGACGRLAPAWKRAIVDALLVSAFVAGGPTDTFDNAAGLADLGDEFQRFVDRSARVRGAALPKVERETIVKVHGMLVKKGQAKANGRTSVLTLRRLLRAARSVWQPGVAAYLIGFFFESQLQAQRSFDEMMRLTLSIAQVSGGYSLLMHQATPGEILPHRGLLARMREERHRGVLVVNDAELGTTMAMRAYGMSEAHWRRFVNLLRQSDADDTWYVPTEPNGEIANFALNRTESYLNAPRTTLRERDFADLLRRAVSA